MAVSEPAPRRGASVQGLRGPSVRRILGRRAKQLLAIFLDNWMTVVGQQRLGPSFGFVNHIRDEELWDAVPDFDPPQEVLSPYDSPRELPFPFDNYDFHDSGKKERDRVSRWGIAIARSDEFAKRSYGLGLKPLFSMIGLVSTRKGVKLAVIDYYSPNKLILAPRRPNLDVGGASFPTFARPWIPEQHTGSPPQGGHCQDGHCWVLLDSVPGILTAKHVVRPENSVVGTTVSIYSKRNDVQGELYKTSNVLDLALIKMSSVGSNSVVPYPFSSTVGYKRVRLVTGYSEAGNQLEADITSMMGFDNAIFCRGSHGDEPLQRAIMTFSRTLGPGDSGCLVIDIENESYGHTHPYLIYQGAIVLGRGLEGYGAFIAQAANEWPLSTCLVAPNAEAQTG